MRSLRWFAGVLAMGLAFMEAPGSGLGKHKLDHLNQRLHGRIIDYTHNHGADNRIWSPALCQRRDLYVYLPPCYDPARQYPLGIYLHGANQDEQSFLNTLAELFDEAIASGKLAPVIIAVPDGSIQGRVTLFNSASFFANSHAGNFEDYVIEDVWNFVNEHYSIRPEREAHALVGASMGGGAAFTLAIKHRDCFKTAIGIHPALNMRWVDCHERYRGKFDPECAALRTKIRPNESLGRMKGVAIRFKYLLDPLVGRGPEALDEVAAFNPTELLDVYDVQEGELDLYVAYGGKDELNIDAQVESFLCRARERGLTVGVGYDPKGKHDLATGVKLFPGLIDWVAPLVAPYGPDGILDGPGPANISTFREKIAAKIKSR